VRISHLILIAISAIFGTVLLARGAAHEINAQSIKLETGTDHQQGRLFNGPNYYDSPTAGFQPEADCVACHNVCHDPFNIHIPVEGWPTSWDRR